MRDHQTWLLCLFFIITQVILVQCRTLVVVVCNLPINLAYVDILTQSIEQQRLFFDVMWKIAYGDSKQVPR